MTDRPPSIAVQRRHLLPRWPSDRIVAGLVVLGLAAALAAGADPAVGLAPGAVAAIVQKVNGHLQAWRRGGVERAFVMESTAISFYVLVAALVVIAVAEAAGAGHLDAQWLVIGALVVDTTVRGWRESRFA